MPPITDPVALAQIAAQQQATGRTLASPTPAPYYPPDSPSPAMPTITSLPQRQQQLNKQGVAQLQLSRNADARAQAKSPAEISNANTEAAKNALTLRDMRIKDGLDPDTGKPLPNGGKFGDEAIADLTDGEKNQVKAITQGRFPITSFSMRNPEVMKLVQRAYQYEPGTDLTTFQRRSAAFQKFMSNPNTPILRVNQALQHLERFYDSAHKLDNYGSGVMTSPLNYVRAVGMAATKDPRYVAFATDRDALAGELAAAFKGSNDTSLADKEHWRSILSAANSPEAFDSAIKEAVGLLGGRIEASSYQFKQAVGANADRYDLMSPEARKSYDRFSGDGPIGAEPLTVNELSKDHKTIPVPPGYQEALTAFEKANPPGSLTADKYIEMRQNLDKQFLPENLRSNLDPGEVDNFIKLYNKGAEPTKLPGINVPLSKKHALGILPSEQNRSDAANTGVGVGLTNAGNALAFGVPELTMGQSGRDALHQASAAHPGWALGGDALGSVGGMAALENLGVKGLTKIGEKGIEAEAAKAGEDATSYVAKRDLEASARQKLAGDVAVNSTYSGARGFNDADTGEGLSGAGKGILGGAAGAGAGNVVTKGVTPLLSEKTTQALQQLKGVKLTTLQRLGLGRVEEAGTGVPFTHGARLASLKSFVRDDANRALSNIGETVPKNVEPGTEMNSFVNDRLSAAYNTIRSKIVGSVDGQFANAQTATAAAINTPEKKAMYKEIQAAVKMFTDENGHYTGDGYKAASERLRSLVETYSSAGENQGSVAAKDMARVADQTRKQMQQLIQRQTPEVGARLKSIERGWALKMRIEDASNRALNQKEAIYSPGDKLASIKKLDTSANKGATARGKGLDQPYTQAAAKIMGSSGVPKLSVKETSILGTVLVGSGYATPVIPGTIAALGTSLYMPGIKQIIQKVLTGKRPSAVDNAFIRRAIAAATRKDLTGD